MMHEKSDHVFATLLLTATPPPPPQPPCLRSFSFEIHEALRLLTRRQLHITLCTVYLPPSPAPKMDVLRLREAIFSIYVYQKMCGIGSGTWWKTEVFFCGMHRWKSLRITYESADGPLNRRQGVLLLAHGWVSHTPASMFDLAYIPLMTSQMVDLFLGVIVRENWGLGGHDSSSSFWYWGEKSRWCRFNCGSQEKPSPGKQDSLSFGSLLPDW